MKVCTKCHIEKDESEFPKDNRLKSGLRANCKVCVAEIYKSWRSKNTDYGKKTYWKNKDKINERFKKWNEENKDWRREYKKEYRDKMATLIKQYMLEWRAKNKKYVNSYEKKYRESQKRLIQEKSKMAIEELKPGYIKVLLKRSGFSIEEINSMPFLLDKRKLDISIGRIKKLIKQKQKT